MRAPDAMVASVLTYTGRQSLRTRRPSAAKKIGKRRQSEDPVPRVVKFIAS
jgi:hypothetical protein